MEIYFAVIYLMSVASVTYVYEVRYLNLCALTFCAVVVFLIAGLRWNTDIDYQPYVEMFNDTPFLDDFNYESIKNLYGEAGYLFLNSVFKTLGIDFFMLAFLCAFLSISIKSYVFSGLCKSASLAFCLYLCVHFITIEIIQIRWAVATAFISLAFYFQFLRKYKSVIFCFVLSLGFHYFSFIFIVLAFLIGVNGHKRYVLLLVSSFIFSLVFNPEVLGWVLTIESDVYVIKRIVRYISDPESKVGIFSYLKILIYPALYYICVAIDAAGVKEDSRLNTFLFRLSFTSLSISLLMVPFPIFHYRAIVIAEIFSIILIVNAISNVRNNMFKVLVFISISIGYGAWYVLDVLNYIKAGRLNEYNTWLGLVF